MHAAIQTIWSLFGSMDDGQRNLLLKGLLARSSTKQFELLSTLLFQRDDDTKLRREVSVRTSKHRIKHLWSRVALLFFFDTHSGRDREMPKTESKFLHESHSCYMNEHLYIKMLNSSYDTDAIVKQMEIASEVPARTMVEFLATRCHKMHNIILSMRNVVLESDIEDSLKTLLKCAMTAVDCQHGTLYTVESTNGDIIARSSSWRRQEAVVAESEIFKAALLLSGEAVNEYNVKLSDDFTDSHDAAYGPLEPACILSVPIVAENSKVVGIIEVINKARRETPPFFTAEDEFVLKGLSSVWILLLNHLQLRAQALRKSDDVKILLKTASLMSSELDLGDLIKIIMQAAQELLKAERCSLFMLDKSKGELWSTVAEGEKEIRIPMRKGIAGHVASTGEILNIPNAYNDRRFNRSVDLKTGFKTRNILCMPLRNTRGDIIGVTQIINKLPISFTFSKEDEMLLGAFSSLAAVTIEKSLLFQQLQGTLEGTNRTKNFLSMILNSITNVVMTLDGEGRLVTVNHPSKLGLEPMLATMKVTGFDYWLGKENHVLINDLQRVYRGEGTVQAQNCNIYIGGEDINVNYTIVKMTELIPSNLSNADSTESYRSRQASTASGRAPSDIDSTAVAGVVLVIEDISKEKRVMATLGRYMSPSLVSRVMAEGNAVLAGTRQAISVLFANLRGFAAIADKMDPTDVVAMLNQHYAYVVDAIAQESGILDKYMGDTAMGVFGVPYPDPLDSTHAVTAALKMQVGIKDLNRRNAIMRRPELAMGVGIATGPVVSGNIGCSKRTEFTVIGEAANIARQIQNATKQFGVGVAICDQTHAAVRDFFHTRELDSIMVKGRLWPIVIYEVVSPISLELPQEVLASFICYELGLREYRAQNWSVAMTHFRKAMQVADDLPSKTLYDRCKGLLEGKYQLPAPDQWRLNWPH
ncbi:hypothetical protein DFJ73DRAFT_625475 [Zopfochytrium polystomum]|nr:hypothetical protein DFJ73DRAFT_625475 [Zopfochytrium polystomum]